MTATRCPSATLWRTSARISQWHDTSTVRGRTQLTFPNEIESFAFASALRRRSSSLARALTASEGFKFGIGHLRHVHVLEDLTVR